MKAVPTRVLLDTNILIHREAAHVQRDDIGLLFNWLDRLEYLKCVHPGSVAEINKHPDDRTRATFSSRSQSYHRLRAPSRLRQDVAEVASGHDVTDSDRIDTLLLNELAAGTVDILISEDRKIAAKAQELGLTRKVFTIEGFLEKTTAENPEFADYDVLSVRRVVFGRVDVADAFFHSLRHDYPGFNAWFARKVDEPAYVCYEGDQLVAFMYLKVEGEREAYADITPQMEARRRLKIGTLKVELNGFKLGERFLKIAFDNALMQKVDEIYVTVMGHSLEQKRLINLLEDFGFAKFGEKKDPGGVEDVYIRAMEPRFKPANPMETFPFVSRGQPWYMVSIYPKYHTSLLPDSILRTESPDNFVEQEPHRNAIRKVYISRAGFRDLCSGDAIVFYRTGGYHKGVVTSLGVVDRVHLDIKDEREFVALCRQRSVFTDAELREEWNNGQTRPFIVEFLYSYAFPRRPNLATLIEAGIIRDVWSAPRGFELLSSSQVEELLKLTSTDPRLIVG